MNSKPRICVIDDDQQYLADMRVFLEEDGYPVCTCSDARDSFVIIKNFKPDCLVLDLMMPVFDGNVFLPWLRHEFPNLPVVICSGTDGFDRGHFGRYKVYHFVQKPFSPDELYNAIQSAVKPLAAGGQSSVA